MTTIHIKTSVDVKDEIISDLMNVLTKHGFKNEKYLGMASKIVMARKEQSSQVLRTEKHPESCECDECELNYKSEIDKEKKRLDDDIGNELNKDYVKGGAD